MAHLWNGFLVPAIRKGGAANCLVVHDATPHAGDNYVVRRLMIRNDIRQADLVLTLSESVHRDLIERFHCRAEQVRLSSIGPFRYGDRPSGRPRRLGPPPHRLLFFGRLLPYKGLDRLIDAMRLLAQQGVPATLRVVGEGSIDLPELPSSVEIDRRWVPEDEIATVFAGSDLVILPYQEASQSGVIPIAQHLGVPVLVTPVGGLLEQVDFGRRGYVAAASTAAALAAAIAQVLGDPQGYVRMSAAMTPQGGGDGQWLRITDAIVDKLQALAADQTVKSFSGPDPCHKAAVRAD